MIVITGGAGFIGSALLWELNESGYNEIIIVDKLIDNNDEKNKNINDKKYSDIIDKDIFIEWLNRKKNKIDVIIHLGACTDTTEYNVEFLMKNNYEYSKSIWDYCTKHNVKLIYASSAATYGNGSNGFDDDETKINDLNPLNPYGLSKHLFDKWVLLQKKSPMLWYGLKFFNVYGPNEYHKANMSSMIYQAYLQIRNNGKMRLFKSYKPEYKNGEQKRDFIYIKDVVKIIKFFINNKIENGIYNIGTGNARSFNDIILNIFKALNKQSKIEYIDMPANIKSTYQYYTKAEIRKLRMAGYKNNIQCLEDGIYDYIKNYLESGVKYL